MRTVTTLALALFFASTALAEHAAHADELYGRLIAPCCWNQTLDIHDSEIATQLRVEIAERLTRGEPALAIEDDLAARFGARIRAVPRAQDPRQSMALSVVSGLTLLLLGLFVLAFRWTRARAIALEELADDEYDARLDQELSRDRA
jgi:cytochrome c-type biogenesis protein CcmH